MFLPISQGPKIQLDIVHFFPLLPFLSSPYQGSGTIPIFKGQKSVSHAESHIFLFKTSLSLKVLELDLKFRFLPFALLNATRQLMSGPRV